MTIEWPYLISIFAAFIAGILIGLPTAPLLMPVTAQSSHTPSHWINQTNIEVYTDKVIIRIDNPQWATFAPTGSMRPVLDSTAHAIQITPQHPNQLSIGDIISFRITPHSPIVIHRIIEIGHDTHGWFAITKGDNNPTPDAHKVRFHHIDRVLIAIIY